MKKIYRHRFVLFLKEKQLEAFYASLQRLLQKVKSMYAIQAHLFTLILNIEDMALEQNLA